MPREKINTTGDPYSVKVGWDHLGSVQVGVEGEDERSLFWLLLGHDTNALELLGTVVRECHLDGYQDNEERARVLLDAIDVASSGGYKGVWSRLDRHGCNQLIRILRKARDAAFGRDE